MTKAMRHQWARCYGGTSVTNTSQLTKVPSVKLADIANVSIGDERKSISKTNGKMQLMSK